MNTDLSWGEVRWREQRSSPSTNEPTMTTTSTILGTNRPISADAGETHHVWPRSSREASHGIYAPQAYPYAQTSSRLLDTLQTERRMPSNNAPNGSRTPRQSPNASPRPVLENSRSGSMSERPERQNSASRRISELQIIPGTFAFNELPRFGATDRVSPPTQNTLLPSFASLEESTNHDDRQKVASHNVGKPGLSKCRGCAEKTAAIDDIALSATDLDEALHAHGSEPGKTRPQRPQDCSLSTAQWVLERLRDARAVLRTSLLPASLGSRSNQPSDRPKTFPSRSLSPPGVAKRPSELHEGEPHPSKRQRISSHTDHYPDSSIGFQHQDEHRRASESLQKTEPMRTFSPSLSDSWASSMPARQQSPGSYARSLRPLPSPSSLATASHKPSWTGLAAPPGSSPTAGHQSIHSTTPSTAASQHIADLQHQVTLKSLALQTLQSEYTSLLQKFQRDRLRSQTFEKKTVAADQEINELTAKNEELTDQVRTLETQLEECEKKRETERSDSAREKDQWGKMLEMSGRLQAKGAEDRQKLLQEKDSLQQRLRIHENEAALSANRKARSPPHKTSTESIIGDDSIVPPRKNMEDGEHETAVQVAALQRDNAILQTRTNMLRSTLERIEDQYAAMVEKRRQIMEQEAVQIPSAITMALQEDSAFARPVNRQRNKSSGGRAYGEKRLQSTGPLSPQLKAHPPTATESTQPGDGAAASSMRSPPTSTKTDDGANTVSSPSTQRQSQAPSDSTSRPKLQTVPLPKWQPPTASAIRTDHIANNQRRPSGPSTPYPGSESQQPWQSINDPPMQRTATGRKPSLPTQLPVFATEKTPARDYTPRYAPPAPDGAEKPEEQNVAAAMPPPPRPGGGPLATTNVAGSWRPSE